MLKRMIQSGWKGNGILIDQIKDTYVSMNIHGMKKLYPGSTTKLSRVDIVGDGLTFDIGSTTEFAHGYEVSSKGDYRFVHNNSYLELDNGTMRKLVLDFARSLKSNRMIIK